MLYKLFKTKLFSTYIPLGGVVYFTSLLFYMAGKEEARNKFINKDKNKLS
jgi:hypothetical protein